MVRRFPEPPDLDRNKLYVGLGQALYCDLAQQFFDWSQNLLGLAKKHNAQGNIDRAILTLLRNYMESRHVAEPGHRDYHGTDHVCLWQVFEQTYKSLVMIAIEPLPPVQEAIQTPASPLISTASSSPPTPPEPQFKDLIFDDLEIHGA